MKEMKIEQTKGSLFKYIEARMRENKKEVNESKGFLFECIEATMN